MPTINQLICHCRESKWRTQRTRALTQCPQKQGVCMRISTRTPKKPNSALRKIAKVRLITGGFWGKPMWGTFWVWDARLTSVLILFFIYLGALRFQEFSADVAKSSK